MTLGDEAAEFTVTRTGSRYDNGRMACSVIQKGSDKESDSIVLSRLALMDQTIETIGVGNGQGLDASLPSRGKELFRG